MKKSTVRKAKSYAVSIAAALLAGGLSAVFAMSSADDYSKLVQPPLAPPSWLFPVVWSILFVLMGISAARVYTANTLKTGRAIKAYAVQLIANVIWTPLYFTLGLRLAAFIWLLVLLALVIVMVLRFRAVDRAAAYLQIPYVLWIIFAGYLNLGTYLLNG